MTHQLPNSLATKRKPNLRMQRLDATGTVSKHLIFKTLLLFVLDRGFIQITVFALEQEKECALKANGGWLDKQNNENKRH
jgi:hypothetical protein